MSANDNFSLHDDEELSLHDDASLDGSVPASNKGDAPAKPPQIHFQTLNCPSFKKMIMIRGITMWGWENGKKTIIFGNIIDLIEGSWKMVSFPPKNPPTTQEEQFADEKERKARTLLLMAVPKDHLRRFHGMDDAKEIWAAIKTRFGGNANSKKMQKAVLKQQFEAFTISSKESLEKGYDRFQKLLSQLDALGAGVSDEDANHKFLRSLPPAWDSLAMTMRTKKNIDTLSIDDLYNNLSVFEQDIQKTSSSSLTSDNVAFLSQAKASSSKHKPSHSSGSYSSYTTSSSKATTTATPGLADEVIHSFLATNADDVDLIHEDLDQIDDLDLEEMDINWQIAMTAIKIKKFYKKTGRRPRVDGKMHVAFDKRKVECFNCHNTGHFARECKFKGSKEGNRQEAGKGQNFKPVQIEKEALMTIDEGQINWVEQTTDEELNHALMAFTVNNEKAEKYRKKGMKAVKDKDALQKIVDSWFASSKNLWKLIDCGMSSTVKIGLGYGIKSNAEVLGYEEEISRGIFAFRETNAGYNDIPLYSRFKQVEYKGVPHPLSGDYTPREQEDIDDSLYEYVNDDPIHDHIPIPSIEQVTIATQKTQPQVPKPTQTVDPSCAQHVKSPRQPIRTPVTSSPIPSNNRQNWNQRMERDLGAGYSFERKPCFVCGSLSHLIKDCDYYEKKMAREAALKSKRVVHEDVRQATPAWTNTNRVNKANQFTPRPVQLSNIRPNLSTASKTVNSGSVHVNSGTQIKSGSSRFNTGKQNVNSGSNDNFTSGRVNRLSIKHPRALNLLRHMTGNRAHHEDYQDCQKWESFTFGGSKGSISGKGTIRLGNLVFDDVAFVKELGHFNLFSISQICDKKLNVLFTEKECYVVSSDFKMPDANQVLLKVPRQHNMYTFDMKNVDSSKGYTCLLAKASSNEAKLWHRRLGHLNFKNLNKLVKDNLVRGLPSKSFKNDHTCVACQKGKQHKASCKAKIDRYVTHPLHTLHMDLFGPTSVRSINHASYCLVITDDCSRFCWVFFLAKKDETSDILKTFIRQIENQLNQKVKIIRSDNGTEFKNRVMLEFCGEKGIKQEFSNARTPQQNGVAERMNRTLIEAARTIAKTHNKIPVSVQNQANPAGSKEVIDIDVQTEEDADLMVVSSTSLSEKIATKKNHSPRQPSSTPISKSAEDIMTFRNELDALALKHLGPVPTTVSTSTNPVNTGSINLNTAFEEVNTVNTEAISPSADHEEEVFSDADDDEMPEIRIYDKSSEGIFEKASYDDEGIISDFNNLPDEVDVPTNPTLRIHNAHPQSQILGDPNTPVQTRSSLKKITEAHALVSYIQANQRSNHKDQQHCLFACFLSQ
ncbi:putative ribonuclease H-like domain-containing protein, partial [Tanacetum coccineum]